MSTRQYTGPHQWLTTLTTTMAHTALLPSSRLTPTLCCGGGADTSAAAAAPLAADTGGVSVASPPAPPALSARSLAAAPKAALPPLLEPSSNETRPVLLPAEAAAMPAPLSAAEGPPAAPLRFATAASSVAVGDDRSSACRVDRRSLPEAARCRSCGGGEGAASATELGGASGTISCHSSSSGPPKTPKTRNRVRHPKALSSSGDRTSPSRLPAIGREQCGGPWNWRSSLPGTEDVGARSS